MNVFIYFIQKRKIKQLLTRWLQKFRFLNNHRQRKKIVFGSFIIISWKIAMFFKQKAKSVVYISITQVFLIKKLHKIVQNIPQSILVIVYIFVEK